MLIVTDSAKALVADMLAEHEAAETDAARLVIEGEDYNLQVDTAGPEDETYEHGGRTVLILAPSVTQTLDQMVLDTTETEEGTELALRDGSDAGEAQ
jgi:Fe-S cluster assembly iron-binding protein IscA